MLFSPRRKTETDDPAIEAARLLSRLGLILLFIISQVAPIVTMQTIYFLLPIGAVLLLLSASLSPDPGRLFELRALATKPPVIATIFFVAWTALSLAWTPFSAGPAERFAKSSATLALVAAACGLLPERTKTSNLNLLPIGAGAAAVILAGVAIGMTVPPNRLIDLDIPPLQRAGLGLALLAWPALGALAVRERRNWTAALAAATVVACALSGAPHVLLALGVGAVVFVVSLGRTKRVAKILAYIAAAVILLAPIVAGLVHLIFAGQAPGFAKPLEVWGHIVANDGARVLTGHGFGAAIYGILGHYLYQATPRSLVFEVWFDLGILGAAALAAVAARAFVIVGRVRAALAPFLLGGLATGVTISVTGPAAEQLWWLTFAGLNAIAFALVMRGQFRRRRPSLPVDWGAAAESEDAASPTDQETGP
jgi:hypothetical protein